MGFRHLGPPNHRYLVPEPEAEEIMAQVMYARDELQLSWWKVSDHVDRYLAQKHSRPTTLRCNRTEWTAGKCRKRYLGAKSSNGTKPPKATHRRCNVCQQTKPIDEFSRNGRYLRRTCKLCRAMRSFTKMEKARQQAFIRCIRRLAQLNKRGRLNSPQADQVLAEMTSLCGSEDAAAEEWIRTITLLADRKPKMVLNQLMLLVAAAGQVRKAQAALEPDFAAMTDAQLNEVLEQFLEHLVSTVT
jgi:hypothetical protein